MRIFLLLQLIIIITLSSSCDANKNSPKKSSSKSPVITGSTNSSQTSDQGGSSTPSDTNSSVDIFAALGISPAQAAEMAKNGELECPTGQLLYGISADAKLLCRDISSSGVQGTFTCKDVNVPEKTLDSAKKTENYLTFCEAIDSSTCPDGWLVISQISAPECLGPNANQWIKNAITTVTWDGAGSKSYPVKCTTDPTYNGGTPTCPQVKRTTFILRCCGIE